MEIELGIFIGGFLALLTMVVAGLVLIRLGGVSPLSQGVIGGCSTIGFYWGAHFFSPLAGFAVAAGVALLLGFLHLVFFYVIRPAALLIASAALQIVFEQFWLVTPRLTGGSGGLLLAQAPSVLLLELMAITFLAGLSWAVHLTSRRPWSAKADTLAGLGPAAGAFGINHRLLLGAAMGVWGLSCALWGLLVTSSSGIIALSNFDIAWSITAFLTAVFCAARKYALSWSAALTLLFVTIRYVLATTLHDSALLANLFDVAFPTCLMVLVIMTGTACRTVAK